MLKTLAFSLSWGRSNAEHFFCLEEQKSSGEQIQMAFASYTNSKLLEGETGLLLLGKEEDTHGPNAT